MKGSAGACGAAAWHADRGSAEWRDRRQRRSGHHDSALPMQCRRADRSRWVRIQPAADRSRVRGGVYEATPEERHGGRFSVQRVPVEPVARGRTAAERRAAPARVPPASSGCSGWVRWPQLPPFGAVAWPAPPRRSASRPKHARVVCGRMLNRATFVHGASRGYKLPLLVPGTGSS